MSGAFGHERFDRRDEELEHLRRLVRDFELEVRGRRWRRDLEKHVEGSASVGGSYGESSHQSRSLRHRDWSWEYTDRDSILPEGRQP